MESRTQKYKIKESLEKRRGCEREREREWKEEGEREETVKWETR